MFSSFYAAGRRHYYAGEYQQALDAFRQALGVAVSVFAEGDCAWWIAGCRAAINHPERRLYL